MGKYSEQLALNTQEKSAVSVKTELTEADEKTVSATGTWFRVHLGAPVAPEAPEGGLCGRPGSVQSSTSGLTRPVRTDYYCLIINMSEENKR